MRRLAAIFLLLVAVPVVLVFGTGARGGGGGDYKVRAIFDFVRAVPGEDVKVAGAKVGTISGLDVTPDNKAVVVLNIQKSGFYPFHQDAHCIIRPQSLIGETFADCQPGSNRTPVLPTIQHGDGKGQHLLPVTHTSSPVDIDEINDIWREPTRERLAILINEFGTALAGRGKDLNAAIHRANPALRDTDKVLAILASQNRTLARLAVSSDRVLAPLAARRQHVADFIVQANKTGQATAERRADISAGIQRFPAFLRQLRPTLADLGGLADQMTPVITDFGKAAPGLNTFTEKLGPFAQVSIPALKSLGQATVVGRPALVNALPVVTDLKNLSVPAKPVSKNLDAITASLKATGGIERFMDYIFFQITAINGFDSVSHYLRTHLLINSCSPYTTRVIDRSCHAYFVPGSSSSAATAQAASNSGATGGGEVAQAGGRSKHASLLDRLRELANPNLERQRQAAVNRVRSGASSGSPELGKSDPALNYLLGP